MMAFSAYVCQMVANWLPRQVVYWCGQRILKHATTGIYANTYPSRITVATALKRWEFPARD